jgi:hypothetical protein
VKDTSAKGLPAPLMELNKEDSDQLVAARNTWLQALQALTDFEHHLLEAYVAARGSRRLSALSLLLVAISATPIP